MRSRENSRFNNSLVDFKRTVMNDQIDQCMNERSISSEEKGCFGTVWLKGMKIQQASGRRTIEEKTLKTYLFLTLLIYMAMISVGGGRLRKKNISLKEFFPDMINTKNYNFLYLEKKWITWRRDLIAILNWPLLFLDIWQWYQWVLGCVATPDYWLWRDRMGWEVGLEIGCSL